MKKTLILAAMALLVLSCKSDPYANGPKVYGPGKPAEKILPPNYSLDASDEMYFEEGKAGTYTIRAIVPAPGKPILSFENMPQGMSYNSATQELTWTPSMTDGNDPGDPSSKKRYIPLTILLQNSSDASSFIRRQVYLVVVNVMQKMEFTSYPAGLNSIDEGEELTLNWEFVDQDFPNGPFTIFAPTLPPGAELSWDPASTKVSLNYTPSFKTVTGWDFEKNFNTTLKVINPAGRTIMSSLLVKVSSKKQNPLVTGPTVISQGMSARFSVVAEDVNGENEPTFDIFPVEPKDGTFSINSSGITSSGDQNPKSLATIEWTDLPASYAGKSQTLRVRACANFACTDHVVTVSFTATVNAPSSPTTTLPTPAPGNGGQP